MIVKSKVLLPTVTDVKDFISVMNKCVSDDVVLKSGRYVVNVKKPYGHI